MFLFSTDIDGTIYDGPDSARVFAGFWDDLSTCLPARPVLVYNTGRSLPDTQRLVEETELPGPDWFICDVGTTIFDGACSRIFGPWRRRLQPGWDSSAVREVVSARTPAVPQPPDGQGEFKCSWYWEDAPPAEIVLLEQNLLDAGIDAQVVYSSNRDLDVLPAKANKGNAIDFLAREIGMDSSRLIVAGDSGNDAAMFLVDGVKGIVVANAEDALRNAVSRMDVFHAPSPSVRGVIEGIVYHSEGEAPAAHARRLA